MSIETMGDRRRDTCQVHGRSVETLGIVVERRTNGAGSHRAQAYSCNELIIMFGGQALVQRSGEGMHERCFARAGTGWTGPIGFSEKAVLSDSIDCVHLCLPSGLIDRSAVQDFDVGVIKAWGRGTNRVEPIEIGLDLKEPRANGMLLAGRYTILDHESALQRLMPLAIKKQVDVIVGGPYNSGALVGGAHFEYGRIPHEIAERVKRITALCEKHSVPIKAAALHFSLAHPAVAAIVPGSSKPSRIAEDVAAINFKVPAAFWRDLRAGGAVAAGAPLPIDKSA